MLSQALLVLAAVVQSCLSSGLYESTVEAHGPLARLAIHTTAHASGPLQYYASPAPVTSLAAVPIAPTVRAAPLAVAAPVAAVDVLHHIPSVADIPITRYSAYPGYIQRYVDVPTAQIAKAKLQVRRPAIHKQFYDIEKRTVVRPLGSAVVELDEPISKNLVSPFAVGPGGYHTVAQYRPVSAYPTNPYPFVSYAPFQTPIQPGSPIFLPQTPVIAQYPQLAQRPVISPQPPQQYPTFPAGPQQPSPPVPQPPQQYPTFPIRPQQPSPVPPQQFPQPSNPSTENVENTNEEFDDSDTVVIENPEFARSSADGNNQLTGDNTSSENGEQSITNSKEKSIDNEETARSMDVINEFQSRQLLRQYLRKNNFQPLQLNSFLLSQKIKNNLDEQPTPQILGESDSITEVETKPDVIDTSNTPQDIFRAAVVPPQAVERAQLRMYSSEGQIASVRNLTPEDYQDNQRKLIELLTGSGDVTEIGTSRSGVKISSIGDAGVFRGRVISVTAAPDVTDQGTERVSTRRVVVSRPIQTLEEVDVHQPITKLERLAVHEPAVLETAHHSIARVPTAVPVVSRTLATAPAAAFYH